MTKAATPGSASLVLLPGMDGTGRLFADFVRALPSHYCPSVVSYSTDEPRTYDDIDAFVRARLGEIDGTFVLIAESYSGPAAIRIAATPPPNLAALVLVATFVCSPVNRWWRLLARPSLFSRPPPRIAIRHQLVGPDAGDDLVDAVVEAIRLVHPDVMAQRAREVLSVDVRGAFSKIEVPMLFIAGKRDRRLKTDRVAMQRLNRRLQWVEVDAPHLVLQTAPEEAAKAIRGFLGDVLEPEA